MKKRIARALLARAGVAGTAAVLTVQPRHACPNCAAQMPQVRAPKSGRPFLWGGVTCPQCGCEMDKWGRRLAG